MAEDDLKIAPAAPAGANGLWVRRPWCLWTGLGLVIAGFISNLVFLYHHCPFDLSEDESHYWQWSHHLAAGYYSKGPGIALIIHAAVVVGHSLGYKHVTMPIVRTPAVIFALISGLASLFLTRRIFRDDRAGLMVIVLSAAVPVFVVGSLLITIDSPMYCFWALAIYALWGAVELSPQESAGHLAPARPLWLYATGALAGLGILCKPIPMFLAASVAVMMLVHPLLRRRFKTWHSLGAVLAALVIQIPTLIWNAQHHWIMFLHIGGEGGLEGKILLGAKLLHAPLTFGMYVLSQFGIAAGFVALFIVLAIVWAIRHARGASAEHTMGDVFLLALALPLWGFYAVLSLWTKVEPNWPAAVFFPGMILAAGWATEKWNQPSARRRAWRGWIVVAVIWGFSLVVLAENVQRLYPVVAKITHNNRRFSPHHWDPAFRLHGMKARAEVIEAIRERMAGKGGLLPMVITDRWDTSSSLAFYLPDRPFVFCIGSLIGGRQSQFDLWPGLNQLNPKTGKLRFLGRDAVLTGSIPWSSLKHLIYPAFDKVVQLPPQLVYYHGVVIKRMAVWECFGFKGLPKTKRDQTF